VDPRNEHNVNTAGFKRTGADSGSVTISGLLWVMGYVGQQFITSSDKVNPYPCALYDVVK